MKARACPHACNLSTAHSKEKEKNTLHTFIYHLSFVQNKLLIHSDGGDNEDRDIKKINNSIQSFNGTAARMP